VKAACGFAGEQAMIRHIRVHLLLIAVTFALSAIAHPLVVWGFGRIFFPTKAAGSLLPNGSRLIGQNFKGKEYFQPRPSAAGDGYDAKASGASNWGASSPKLRDRVARQLGPIVKFSNDPKNGDRATKLVGPFVEHWIAENPDLMAAWVRDRPDAAPLTDRIEIQQTFFDSWLQAHPDFVLEQVPADMVTASGSGLDPHITLKNALYQLDRVADGWAEKTGRSASAIKAELEPLVRERARPVFGLAGEPLVNVLELNLAVRERMQR